MSPARGADDRTAPDKASPAPPGGVWALAHTVRRRTTGANEASLARFHRSVVRFRASDPFWKPMKIGKRNLTKHRSTA